MMVRLVSLVLFALVVGGSLSLSPLRDRGRTSSGMAPQAVSQRRRYAMVLG
jgi:hypothetical protein